MPDITESRPPSGGDQGSKTEKVSEQARAVTQSAAAAGGGVAKTAGDQAKGVASDAANQAKTLYGQARSQAGNQMRTQQKHAADGLHALSEEVGKMAEQGGGSGPGTQVARQASDKINQIAAWLDHHEPGDVVDQVKSYARRNPGMFLLGAAALGALAGRLTKNIAGQGDSGSQAIGNMPESFSEAAPGDAAVPSMEQDAPAHVADVPTNGEPGAPMGTTTRSAASGGYTAYEERP
jgi:hypothetical protein